jgi:hypothetical protein
MKSIQPPRQFRVHTSAKAMSVALLLVASMLFQTLPGGRAGVVFASPAKHDEPIAEKTVADAPPQPLQPNAPTAPGITATLVDAFPDPNLNGKAEPGDTITYTATISNTGTSDATGVTFTDSVDTNTTLVPGSVQTQPIAIDDSYNVIGNVRIQPTVANGLLANDRDPDTGNNTGLTASGPATTTQSGNITINADGSFSYNPAPGFAGTDTVTYTITDTSSPTPKTDTAVATFKVGNGTATPGTNVIWFVNSAAGTNGDGRLTSPFNCLRGPLCFDSTTTGGAADDPGDTIFLYSSATAYNGGLTLLNNQLLIGQGASGTLAGDAGYTVPTDSDALPVLSGNLASLTITTTAASTNAINIGTGLSDTLRGFTIGNTTGAKIASPASPPAAAFGTLTVSEVILNGTGQALNLDNGALAATFNSISSTTSAGQGIILDQVSGSLISTNGTTITNPTTQCILVTASTASMNFGNTSCSDATDGISLQNNSANTRTFGTLTVSGTNTGNAFLHSTGGGNVTVTGAASFTSNGNPIDIQNAAAGVINFSGGATVTKTTTGGAGVNLVASSVTFESLGITTSNGPGLSAITSGTVTVTNGSKAISATGSAGQGAPAIIANAVTLNANFSSVTSTNSGNGVAGTGVSLTSFTGTSNLGTGAISGTAGDAFLVNAGTGTVTYNGTISTTAGSRPVNITGKAGGTVNFGGAISSTQIGISLTTNTGATINFTGGLSLSTGGNAAFLATGGGTVNVCDENPCSPGATGALVNTITTTTGTALNVDNTTIGANKLEFKSISAGTGASGPATSGIILNNTGASGGLIVKGDGNTSLGGNSSGGVIQRATNYGISMTSTLNPSFTNMNIHDIGKNGIDGFDVTNFTFANGNVATTGTGSSAGDFDVNSIAFVDRSGANDNTIDGTVSITGSTISDPERNAIYIETWAGTISSLTISNNTFSGGTTNARIQNAIGVFSQGSASGTGSITTASIQNNNISDFRFFDTAPAIDVWIGGNGIRVVGGNPNAASTSATLGTVANPILITGNDIDNVGSNMIAVTFAGKTGLSNFTIQNNGTSGDKMTNAEGNGISVFFGGNGTFNALVDNNWIDNIDQGGNPSGSKGIAVQSDFGLVQNSDVTNSNITVSNNHVSNTSGDGFQATGINNAGTFNLRMVNNAVTTVPDLDARYGIRVQQSNVGTQPTLNLEINGNTTVGAFNAFHTLGSGIGVRKQDPYQFGIEGLSPTPTNSPEAYINSQNPGGAGTDKIAGTGFIAQNVALNRPVYNEQQQYSAQSGGEMFKSGTELLSPTNPIAPLINPLRDATVTAEARNANNVGNESASASSFNRAINSLGRFVASLDSMIEPTAYAETKSEVREQRSETSKAEVRDQRSEVRSHHTTADRQVFSHHAMRRIKAGASSSAPLSLTSDDQPLVPSGAGGTVSVNIGTLAPNDSVTITFQVVVDNPYSGPANVSNQGTVSGSNFSNVLTDDPAVAGAANPTLTPISVTDIRVNDATVAEPAAGTAEMLFTLTLSQPAPGGGISVNYATANGGGTPATGGASCGGTVDYVTTNGTATVVAGSQTATIPVTVCADTASPESSETLLLNISTPSAGAIVDNQATGTITQGTTAGTFLISELRTSGPGGAGDDFVEFYNNTNSPLTVASSDASAGYGLYKMGATCNDTPVLIATIPNGTIIPARGHYLAVGSQYTLANYGGTGAAAGNITMTSDVEIDRNVAVFSTATVANISSANRLDAAGFGSNTGAVCDLLREGNTLGAIAAAPTTEHSYHRKYGPAPLDTNDNAADFRFADTQGTFISGVTQRLGAPGPENLAAPSSYPLPTGLDPFKLDTTKDNGADPNQVRIAGAVPNGSNGTLSIRRRVTNNTGAPVTRLRFRIYQIDTFPSPGGGVADLRAITSSNVTVSGVTDATTCTAAGAGAPPCTVTVRGTTLEQPPTQPNGGGFNSTMALGTVATGTPLANGASVLVQFLFGIQTTGSFNMALVIEGSPGGGGGTIAAMGNTENVPTASESTVSGQILDGNGNPLAGAVVNLSGTQNRKVITDNFGNYSFDNVETGGFYTVTPSRTNYVFSPGSKSFSQLGNNTEAAFAAAANQQVSNPLDRAEYFVRQQYLDFLGREPDESGFNFWSDQILECGNDTQCIERRRENVSAAYFLSIEFQQTGGLVDGLYRASYGVRPHYGEFMPDARAVAGDVVVGRTGWEAKLEANKKSFIDNFANRPSFHAKYDDMDNAGYVAALISNTGVSFTADERESLVNGLTAGTLTRADALRSIAENTRFVSSKFNDTFVMMEYFGYLRRDPDADGYNFWLKKLNQFDGNFEQAEMVKAFINSGEYRGRFPR